MNPREDGEASNADLAAWIRRRWRRFADGACPLCLNHKCDEECSMPTLMLIARRLEASTPEPAS